MGADEAGARTFIVNMAICIKQSPVILGACGRGRNPSRHMRTMATIQTSEATSLLPVAWLPLSPCEVKDLLQQRVEELLRQLALSIHCCFCTSKRPRHVKALTKETVQ